MRKFLPAKHVAATPGHFNAAGRRSNPSAPRRISEIRKTFKREPNYIATLLPDTLAFEM